VRPGFNTQAVVAVTLVLPGLLALPAAKVKLTLLVDKFTVSDSARVAFKAIGWAAEFNCADASDVIPTTKTTSVTTRNNVVCPLSIWLLFSLLLIF
jgi:hypothetical protein